MRVRVTATGLASPLIGSFLSLKGDTAVFIEDGVGRGVWSLEVAEIVKLEQSIGQRKLNRAPMLKGAVWGSIPGAVLAYTFAALASPSDTTRKYSRFPTTMFGAAVGAVVGVGVGSRYSREHWSPVAFARRVSFVPSRHAGRFGVSFTF
jgi:hypothetical protein